MKTTIKTILKELARMLVTGMLVCFNDQLDTDNPESPGKSLNGKLYRSGCSVLMSVGECLDNVGRCSPLWVAAFPNQGVLKSMEGENKLKVSRRSASMFVLSALDRGCGVPVIMDCNLEL